MPQDICDVMSNILNKFTFYEKYLYLNYKKQQYYMRYHIIIKGNNTLDDNTKPFLFHINFFFKQFMSVKRLYSRQIDAISA